VNRANTATVANSAIVETPRKRMGRKSKCTPELVAEIVKVIRIGGSDVDACARVDIPQGTFYRWMQDNQEFNEQVTRARANGKLQRIARIKKHGKVDWRADAWYLERRYPHEFAQQLVIKVTPLQAATLEKLGLGSPSEAFEQFIAAVEAAAVEQAPQLEITAEAGK
jgi:hypothetical protein